MSKEQDAIFVRNLSIMVIVLIVIGIGAFTIAKMISSDSAAITVTDAMIAARLAPVGSANVEEPFVLGGAAVAAEEPVATDTATTDVVAAEEGKTSYGKICFACHDAGIGGAPKHGDVAAWTDRLQKGPDMLVSNAINGFTGETGIMPPKGGLPSLSNDEVGAAVHYMLAALGGEGDSAKPSTAAAVEMAAATPAMSAGRGKEVYDSACFVCHATGVAGAPKLGDATGWAPRVKQGSDTLYGHAIKGFMGEAGLMPPKGGRMDYSDEDVKAAVDYMVSESH